MDPCAHFPPKVTSPRCKLFNCLAIVKDLRVTEEGLIFSAKACEVLKIAGVMCALPPTGRGISHFPPEQGLHTFLSGSSRSRCRSSLRAKSTKLQSINPGPIGNGDLWKTQPEIRNKIKLNYH